MRTLIAILLVAAAPALAQEPDEAAKKAALMRAYELNGNSMVRWGSIDLTNEPTPVKTDRIIPLTKAEDKNELDEQADNIDRLQQKWVQLRGNKKLPGNICEEHGMRKVTTGNSWRCRK